MTALGLGSAGRSMRIAAIGLIFAIVAVTATPNPASADPLWGAIDGAIIGGIFGGGEGAAAGALIGGMVGAADAAARDRYHERRRYREREMDSRRRVR